MRNRELSPIRTPDVIILGILGYNSKMSEKVLYDTVLNPILEELGRYPDRILIPTEGNTSIYIQDWAETFRIPFQAFHADWIKYGRIAQILRDDRIQKECTHTLIFLGAKSNKMEKIGEKLAKKGKTVFTSSYHTHELEQLVWEPPQKALEPVHKLDTGIKQLWQKYQKKAEC